MPIKTNDKMFELLVCAHEQGYGLVLDGHMYVDMLCYFKLKEIYNETYGEKYNGF